MLAKTRTSLITNLIKEIAKKYSVEASIVEDTVCASLSEVLSEELGYRVEADLKHGELSLIGRISQNGIEKDIILSSDNLKKHHFDKINLLLIQKLDVSENGPLLRKYKPLIGTIVVGKATRKTGYFYYVNIENVDENVMGICQLMYISPIQRGGTMTGLKAYYQVIGVGIEKIKDRCRVVIQLSRSSKTFPCELLKKLSNDESLIVKCNKRAVGRVCHLEVNKYITKRNIKLLRAEMPSENIVLSMTKGVANERS